MNMDPRQLEQVTEVAHIFGLGTPSTVQPVTNGHINLTFRVEVDDGIYIIQRINGYVFPDPQIIMENIEKVTAHLREKLLAEGRDPDRGTLRYLHNDQGSNYTVDAEGNFWRVCPYIAGTRSCEHVENLRMLESAGYAFGEFQRMLSDLPMDSLHETIVDFHNTRKRMNDFFAAVEADPVGRVAQVQEEIAFFAERREQAGKFTGMLERGELPLRVTHNDTKYNNILLDEQTFDAVCVVDLDTVMPGLSLYDYGDAIRCAASTGPEDAEDQSTISINMEYFETFTRGFMQASGGAFTRSEIDNFALGCINITIELASRFLMDYINGDKYFAISRPLQNLDRARTQIKMALEMERHYDEMDAIIKRYVHQA